VKEMQIYFLKKSKLKFATVTEVAKLLFSVSHGLNRSKYTFFEQAQNNVSHGLTVAKVDINVVIDVLPHSKLAWQKLYLTVANFCDAWISHPQDLRGKNN
jgi:hypothetical protein